jgi:hypothetical protein
LGSTPQPLRPALRACHLPVPGRTEGREDEVFLVHPCRQLDDLRRHVQERLVEAAEQRHGPFRQTGILRHQSLVLDQRQSGVAREFRSAGADQRLALVLIDDHVAGAELFNIVVRAAQRDRAGVVEAVAEGRVLARDAGDLDRHEVFAEDRDDAVQRPHPA